MLCKDLKLSVRFNKNKTKNPQRTENKTRNRHHYLHSMKNNRPKDIVIRVQTINYKREFNLKPLNSVTASKVHKNLSKEMS